MKKLLLLAFFIVVFSSCSKKEKFVQPEYILNKWCKSIENLKYSSYKKYEAYPKSLSVFKEIYSTFFFKTPVIIKIDDLNEENIYIDSEKHSYIKRNVTFECTLHLRKNGKMARIIKGDVDFIKFVNSVRSSEGWLMSNRSLIHIK